MEEKIYTEINTVPSTALDEIYEVQRLRTSVTNLKFFCCCCVTDDELEVMTDEGTASLNRLILGLRKLMIPKKEYSGLSQNALSQAIKRQQFNTWTLLEDSIDPDKYPGLTSDYTSVLSKLLRSLPAVDVNEFNEAHESEDSINDSRNEFN